MSFLFWKPASTRRDPRFSLSVPLCGATVGLRAVAPFRNRKMLAVQALRVFNKTIRAFSHFPSRVCFFTHLLQKKKLTQSCEFFLLETGVDILSRARVRVIHRALLRCAAKCAARGSPITRCIPFASGKSFRSRTPRFNKTIRTVADFPSADLCLAVHGKSFPSCTKQKHPTDVECFCFGNRRRHTLPGRVQPSTICADELNFCVRYENRWDLIAIDTGNR